MRLIDADALLMAIPDTSADIFENCRNCKLLDKEQITDIINNAPTVEAEPIPHGHWIEVDPQECYMCSVCSSTNIWEDIYCPECGAKMDERVEEDE